MIQWFYRTIQTRIQRAKHGTEKFISKRVTGINDDERWVTGKANSL